MSPNNHTDRFPDVTGTEMPVVSHKILWYAFGMGGRIFDLPRQYQDAVARSVTVAHPQSFYRRAVVYCMTSGRFKPSTHPMIAGLTTDEYRRQSTRITQAQRHAKGLKSYPDRHAQLAAARAAKAAKAERLRNGSSCDTISE